MKAEREFCRERTQRTQRRFRLLTPALSSNEEEREKTLRSLRSLAAHESVCIGVHPWLKESHA